MARKYSFKVKRVKVVEVLKSPNTPDFHSIIRLNKTLFTFTSWLDDRSDLSCILEEITPERLEKDKYLRNDYRQFTTGRED